MAEEIWLIGCECQRALDTVDGSCKPGCGLYTSISRTKETRCRYQTLGQDRCPMFGLEQL